MMLLVLLLVMMPLAATSAGFIVWVGHRDEALDDGTLVRTFLITMVVVLALLWAIGRTESVHKRLDPQFRIQTEIEANPVYAVAKRLDSNTAKALREHLEQQMSAGATLSQAMSLARPRLTGAVQERLGFADQDTRIMWGRLMADTLRELRSADPDLCYAAMTNWGLDAKSLAQAFSADNTARFEQAVVRVYESSNRGMGHDYRSSDERASSSEVRSEFGAIQADIEQRFDHSIAVQMAARQLPESPADSTRQLCSARIFQLEEMLERPKPVAAALIDGTVR